MNPQLLHLRLVPDSVVVSIESSGSVAAIDLVAVAANDIKKQATGAGEAS